MATLGHRLVNKGEKNIRIFQYFTKNRDSDANAAWIPLPKRRRKRSNRSKRRKKDRKGLYSELWGIQRVSINKPFNIPKGLSSVSGLIPSENRNPFVWKIQEIFSVLILSECTRGFNFSLSWKKSESIRGAIVFRKIQGLGRFEGNGYSKRLFALCRFWDWWTETNIFTFYVINFSLPSNHSMKAI